ncbi:HET-domain-containing protein, partial [Hyaloscypha hepaticicola]
IECMAYCSENHRQTCSTMETSPIESLRVIDCQTRTIIQAPPGCQYVALSYVWGPSTTPSKNTEAQNIPPTIQNEPKTISDAIHVTLKLGIRYLWIDRYCIDQSNKDEKHNTIRVMDLIYSNARLTIITTAGENPDYGLPGVRGTVRRVQPRLEVGEHCLVSTLPHPNMSVNNSTWASRGWTYQEGLLSKRRLVFTDHQILYECNGMHCAE